jgi:aconitate hydratase
MNLVEKILKEHLVSGELKADSKIGLKIDQTLTQDATGTATYLQFELMGTPKVKTLAVSYVDHNTVQSGFENADDHKYLQDIAEKYGIYFSRPGNGICHQLHLERFAAPKKTLLGADSHTPTAGGIGALAIGVGGLDVAVAMGGGEFYLQYPKVIRVNLHNKLNNWVSAKDVVLKILEIFTTKGNVGYILEYGGEGIKSLSVPERATITNMGAETGVTTSIFPSDEVTRKFLEAQDRAKDWVELKSDENAEYYKTIDIDLAEIEPMIACPHSPGNVKKVRDIAGLKVDQVCIGSCTNSSYRDLMIAAKILKGKKIHKDVSLIIAPGSRQILRTIDRDGGVQELLNSGARFAECTCGFCIGNCHSPRANSISLRTSNRNFKGRSGTKTANLYLVSPETAATAAITGEIKDPRDLGIEYPEIAEAEYIIDDSMFIPPKPNPELEVYRGENIKKIPRNEELPERISGEVMILAPDITTTDHIMPAGPRLKYRSNIEKYSEFVFEPFDQTFPERCLENKRKGIHNIIIGGLSYGQGSSREHAALCPMFLGVKAVIAKSIERIHHTNLINFGILPLTFTHEKDYDRIEKGDKIEISDLREKIERDEFTVKNLTKGYEFKVKLSVSPREKKILLTGGLLPYIGRRQR